jgi:ribonuclease HII
VARTASCIAVRVIPPCVIDSDGLHRSNLRGLREALADLSPPAEVCLVDGFRLGPLAPDHRAVVDGDTKSAAIAAASIVAKVVRDRVMHRLDALYPGYDFAFHVGYITPGHSAIVRRLGPSTIHRRSFDARCYAELDEAAEAELVTAARA